MAQAEEKLRGEWRVVELNGAPLLPASTATMNFGADGRVSGKASCNRYSATYRVEGATLSFSRSIATTMACAPPLMRQERRFLSILSGDVAWSIADGRLTLTGPGGASLRAAGIE